MVAMLKSILQPIQSMEKELLEQKEGITKQKKELAKEENAIKETRESIKAMNSAKLDSALQENRRLLQERDNLITELNYRRVEFDRLNGIVATFCSSYSANAPLTNKRRRVEDATSEYNTAENQAGISANEISANGILANEILTLLKSDSEKPTPKELGEAEEGVFSDISGDGIFDTDRLSEDSQSCVEWARPRTEGPQRVFDPNTPLQTSSKCNWGCVQMEKGCGERCHYRTLEQIKDFARKNQIQKGGLPMSDRTIANTRKRKTWIDMGKNDPTFQTQFLQ